MNAYNVYLEGRVLAADPLELIRILYEQALASVRHASDALLSGDIEERSQAITSAQLILLELGTSLDHQQGGSLAANLANLYAYMAERLTQAHVEQNGTHLDEVFRLLSTLLEGWRECRPESAAPLATPRATGYPIPESLEPELELAGHSWVY